MHSRPWRAGRRLVHEHAEPVAVAPARRRLEPGAWAAAHRQVGRHLSGVRADPVPQPLPLPALRPPSRPAWR